MYKEHLCKKNKYKEILSIVLCLCFIQGMFLGIKQIVFASLTETVYSRSMVTCLSMLFVLAVTVLYCIRKKYKLSVFPVSFSPVYIVATVAAVAFYAVTVFTVKPLSVQNTLMLVYGSLVTPVFEELLFRGVIWNRFNCLFDKQWKTYLTVTVLFALWHIGYAVGLYLWSGGSLLDCIVMKVAVGALFGLLTGAIRYKTKNCFLGILIHGILNAFG